MCAAGERPQTVIDRCLRRMQALEWQLPSADLSAITGLIPSDIDIEVEWRRHVAEKHVR